MTGFRTLFVVFFVVAVTLFVPRLAWTLVREPYNTGYVVFVVGLAALVAATVASILALLRSLTEKNHRRVTYVVTGALTGFPLAMATFWLPEISKWQWAYPVFAEYCVLVNWAAVCAIAFLIARALTERFFRPAVPA
jgi:hypothetical protein